MDLKRIVDMYNATKVVLGGDYKSCYYICTTSLVKRRDEDGILKGFKGLVHQISKRKRIIIGGLVCREINEYHNVHRGYEFRERNNEVKTNLDFVTTYELIISNTRFDKQDEHLVTYKNGL